MRDNEMTDHEMTDHLKELSAQGVSIWLDDLSRPLITGGGLQELIDTKSVVGVTTNPTIFAAALSQGDTYLKQIKGLAAEGKTVDEAVFDLIIRDVQDACDIMAPLYRASHGEDGRVSIEVDPGLAHDTVKTVEQVRQLHSAVDRPNVYIKIPATVEGLPAIAQVLAEGISVNVTLIFSLDRYRGVMNAFLTGLEQARLGRLDLSQIHSVASFFVSRVDSEVDKRLDAIDLDEAIALRGKAGVANARLAYQAYQEVFSTPRWANLSAEGAHKQRPLWASTGVKDPAYKDTMYVVDLAAPETVNTMPVKTMQAVADHGQIAGDQVTGRYADATNVLDSLERLGISYIDVTALLEREGVEKFEKSWAELLSSVQTELAKAALNKVALGVLASGPAAEAVTRLVPQMVADRVASRLFAKDPTLWGHEAESEASIRLSWVTLGRTSRPLIGEVAALRDHLAEQGADHVVLCGMGGSSLAPQVICATAGAELTVLDSSNPDAVRTALTDRLERAVVVVSSKSGSTVETDSQRRAFKDAFTRAGLDPTERIIIVTDPDSPEDKEARASGYRVINADPNVGGRYSALTAFGLVPSGLAGVDLEQLLDEAESVADLLAEDDDANPALRLAAAMAGTRPRRDKLVLVDQGSGIPGFADWAEQLIAESTGKKGTGVLPVVVQGDPDNPDPEVTSASSEITVARILADVADDEGGADPDGSPTSSDQSRSEVQVSGSLGAQLLLWEVATAAAGRILGVNPFDQPDVESAKKATRRLLEATQTKPDPAAFTDGAIEVRALEGPWLGDATTVATAVDRLLSQLEPRQGYVSIMAYLDPLADASFAGVRRAIALRTQAPTTFGWGPRFLHSTGQYHKGGPATGVYLQITTEPHQDLAIPGRDFTFGDFIAAQAGGDAQVLADRGRPVLRLHLAGHDEGIAQLRLVLGLDPQAGSRTGTVAGS